jgi:hypothetical protein
MTLPHERFRSMKYGKKLIQDLCDPGLTPRVPSIVRERARAILRHYPMDYEMEKMANSCPELLSDKNVF